MSEEKLVSIVLPVYNGAKHVSNSIESVLKQTYKNWELIIVNDCSTDDTLEVITKYQEKDERIRVFSNERNLKLPLTLNVGFSHARGTYLSWTSDDNMYMPEAIEKLVKELEADTSIAMVYSNYTNIDSAGEVISEGILKNAEELVAGNVCGACFLYTAEVAEKAGIYDANLFLAEDYDYWIQIWKHGEIKHIGDSLYFYRRHAGSLTETKKAFINAQTYKALEKNFLFLYTKAKGKTMQYKLFDHMLRRAGENNYDKVYKMLICVDKGYIKKQRVEHWKKSLRNSVPWKLLRNLRHRN